MIILFPLSVLLNEFFLWRVSNESEGEDRERFKEELIDVVAYPLMLAYKNDIDVKQMDSEKIINYAAKYSVDKVKWPAVNYNEL